MNKLLCILESMRPKQWTKNLVIFAALIFSGKIVIFSEFLKTLVGFVLLSLLSGAIYLLNDVVDLEKDRSHPKKKERPIAKGLLTKKEAILSSIALSLASLSVAFMYGKGFFACLFGYLLLQLSYSFFLKNLVLLDVFSIAAGFILRAFSGVYLLSLEISPWLFICAFLLALFLGFGKRRHELLMSENSHDFRPVLKDYTRELLDALLVAVAAATIVSYSLYTFFSETSEKHSGLMWSTPFVVYGMFRYLYLVYSKNLGGNPEEILLTDKPLLVAILCWLAVIVFSISIGQ